MRETDTLRRLLSAVTAAAAAGVLLAAAPAFANEDDEPVRDEGIISNLMRGLGASDGSNGINYRERSPLVVPPKLTLPPPEARRSQPANWPKDPDVLERRAAREALKKRDKVKENDPAEQMRIQPEPELGQARARTATVSPQPGISEDRRLYEERGGILNPSELGVTKGLFGLFRGKKDENVPFTGEPVRESLTQPPPGYQTPSAGQVYGIKEADRVQRNEQMENPSGILAPGKF